jgi:hypothetical protein
MKLSTILQYSTLDFRFLDVNLKQASKFSDEIIVPICDHYFNGTPENQELLEKSIEIASKYPKCTLYTFEWAGPKSNTGYYHNLSRALGTDIATGDWLLFLDTDEIVDDGFDNWFDSIKYTEYHFWLTCYWYFREPIYQATTMEAAGLLIQKSKCNWIIDVRTERQQLFNLPNFVNGDKKLILNENNKPFIHHYSWVRTKEDMINKVKNWGHKNDKNWIDCVEEEFGRSFNGTDFIHGYSYTQVENKFNL